MTKSAVAPVPSTPSVPPEQTSDDLFAIAEKYLPGAGIGAYSLARDIRLVYSHGAGSRMWDVDGKEIYRLCRRRRCVDSGAFTSGGGGGGARADGARRTCIRVVHRPGHSPGGAAGHRHPLRRKIVYATTGSEATAYAMRLARAFTGRDKILKFEGAYHGNHDYAIVSTFPGQTGPGENKPGENRQYPAGIPDSFGQPQATVSTMLVAPYNDLEAVRTIVAGHGRDIAAIIVEGVQRIIRLRPDSSVACAKSATTTTSC